MPYSHGINNPGIFKFYNVRIPQKLSRIDKYIENLKQELL